MLTTVFQVIIFEYLDALIKKGRGIMKLLKKSDQNCCMQLTLFVIVGYNIYLNLEQSASYQSINNIYETMLKSVVITGMKHDQ
jgi:hypothetical protein